MSDLMPAGWAEVSLREVASPRVDRVDPSGLVGTRYLGLEHVEAHVSRVTGCVPATSMKSSCLRFSSGDVLYGRLRPYLNKVARPAEGGVCSPEFIVFSESELVANDFLRYRLNASDVVGFASQLNTGDRPRIDFDQLADFRFRLPPLAEQGRIGAKVDELFSDLDAGVAALHRAQANLKRYRASVLKAAVEGRLTAEWRQANPPTETGAELLDRLLRERRERWEAAQLAKFEANGKAPPKGWREKYVEPTAPDTSKLPALPEGWCWASAEIAGDILLGRQRAPQFLTGRWTKRYLRVANIKDDWIDFSDLEAMDFDEVHFDKYRLEPGDILVSEGQSPELVGQSAIFRGFDEPLCFQKTLHRFRAVPGSTTPEFAQLVFRSHVRNGEFRAVASITTNIAHLTLEKFQASPFPLPPATEQIQIVAMADAQLSSVDALEQSIRTSRSRGEALRQSVLKHAFAGRLVPQDPHDEPASALLERIRAKRAQAPVATRTRARIAKSSGVDGPSTVAKQRKRGNG